MVEAECTSAASFEPCMNFELAGRGDVDRVAVAGLGRRSGRLTS